MVEIILEKNNEDYKRKYSTILEKYEVELQLFLINLKDEIIIDNNNIRGGIYIDNELSLLFINAFPYNLLLYSFNNTKESCEYLARYLIANEIKFKGINGDRLECDSFIKEYNCLALKEFIPNLEMNILKLTEIIKPEVVIRNSKITPYIATMDDYEFIVKCLIKFYYEINKMIVHEKDIMDKVINNITNNRYYILKDANNKRVSMININRILKHGQCISEVYTVEEERNRGYSTIIMYHVCLKILKTSSYVSLFVDQNNPISNKVYASIGFKRVCSQYDYKMKYE